MHRSLVLLTLGAIAGGFAFDAAPVFAQGYVPPVVNLRQTRERQQNEQQQWNEYWQLSPQERQNRVWYPYGKYGKGDPLRNDPQVYTPFRNENGARYRWIDPSPSPQRQHSNWNSGDFFNSTPPAQTRTPFQYPNPPVSGSTPTYRNRITPSSTFQSPFNSTTRSPTSSNSGNGTPVTRTIGFDDNRPKGSPKGVSMRIGIDRGSYRRAEAPRSLLATIRGRKN